MKNLFLFLVFIFLSQTLASQNIKFNPYIQDVTPDSIFILWETDSGDESVVEWGLTNSLGNSTTGTSSVSNGAGRIHTVKIESLTRFTKYFYRVKTGTATSSIYSFKTPPFSSDNESFRIIAMSDMQRDNSQPNKYNEIIHDGILDYLNTEFGGELIDNLALVLIPGDLVVNGNDFSSWENQFFTPSEDLFNQVPVYPVLGNHEVNSNYYFKYFKMPENGSAGFEEHWWYKDYGNVRIIGLDSNSSYRIQEQLDWLDTVLANTCASSEIDFVFAQLHHPFKSELWTPGELDYSGDVIQRLEQFTTDCEKPSIHFFGHTHAYSRGNSRDHKHLWINAATAGGAIDNWGEFPNFDYDEFTVSQDNYGFVSVEVTNDADPKIVIKRISRGDQDNIVDNEITDTMTIRLNPTIVNIPTPTSPVNEEAIPECVTLKATTFSSPNTSAEHGQSHWQVSTNQNDFSALAAESWKNFENWYFEENTQLNDDLTDERIIGLNQNSTYWWRVRYRDKELNWSNWTTPVSFTTGASVYSSNLLLNPDAENDLANWTIVEGIVEVLTDGLCAGISPHSGTKYFGVGGICDHSTVGRCIQNVDVSSYNTLIDNGDYYANFGGYLSDYNGSDLPEMKLIFLDQNSNELGNSSTLSTLSSSWVLLSESLLIPVQTRTIQMELKGTRNAGTDNDSYFDDLFLTIGIGNECGGTLSIVNQSVPIFNTFKVIPNPVTSSAFIKLPQVDYENIKLYIININGSKMNIPIQYESDKIIFDKSNLTQGTYVFWVKNDGDIIGKGKFIVK